MICKVCGRTIANENANFCEYCGASFRETDQFGTMNSGYQGVAPKTETRQDNQIYQQNQPSWQGQSMQGTTYSKEYNPYQQQGSNQQYDYIKVDRVQAKDQPISFWNWLGTFLLPYIPFVGLITYIVMLFIWAFGKNPDTSKRNWARAKLVAILIGIVFTVVMLSSLVSEFISSGMTLDEYVNTIYK